MHLFVRSCGADNIFIVLINLQERYLIVGRFLFTSPLTRPRLIAPRPFFERELYGYLLCDVVSMWRLWDRLYDLCCYKDMITVTRLSAVFLWNISM